MNNHNFDNNNSNNNDYYSTYYDPNEEYTQDRKGSIFKNTVQEFNQTVDSVRDRNKDEVVISKNLLVKAALIALGLDLLF